MQAGALVKQSKPVPGGRVLVGDDLGVWLRLGTDGVAETVKVGTLAGDMLLLW
jgi:hypothetical protein